jgi:type IV pilus assembly protein PilP
MKTAWIAILALLFLTACPKTEEVADAPTVSDFERERAELTAKVKSKGRTLAGAASRVKNSKAAGAGAGAGEDETEEFAVVDHEYVYDATGKRDPFRSFIFTVNTAERDARGPLEQFDLAQLSVVAVVWGTDRPRAVVADPSGRGYIVREGTYMGKNQGRVIGIADNALVVKESYVDYFGDTTTKDVTMRVRADKEGVNQ